ncbi:uncharacterized protein LOC135501630 [Lineus longissimus]|uniref:uncharacterized protein LOC135501630 n=1 Tax=Lineus longissimus TaxID=88925 RepID=UPI00315CCEED
MISCLLSHVPIWQNFQNKTSIKTHFSCIIQTASNMSYGSNMQQNPWDSDIPTLGKINDVLALAERKGYGNLLRERAEEELKEYILENSPSIMLMSLLKGLTRKKKELDRVKLQIDCRMRDKETADITHVDQQEKHAEMIGEMNTHVQAIMNTKDLLINRLQRPYVGKYIKMEAAYHRYAGELFKLATPILADLAMHLDDIKWSKNLNVDDGAVETILGEISSALAEVTTNFQSMLRVRDSMKTLHDRTITD